MKKQSHILVIGDSGEVVPELFGQQQSNHKFTYCARDNYANSLNDQPGRYYDWIVIDGGSLGGDKTELIQSLRAMGIFLQPTEGQEEQHCAVEWSQEGVLQLRCCMQGSRNKTSPAVDPVQDEQQDGFVFEYHAPMKRTG